MIANIRKNAGFFYIVLVLFSVALGITVAKADSFSDSHNAALIGYCEEMVWTSTVMLMAFLFMHTRYYKNLAEGHPDKVSIIIGVAIFGNLAALGTIAGNLDYFTIFRFNVVVILVSGLCGGWKISVPSAVYCSLTMIPFPDQFYWADYWMILLMAVAAVMGGYTRHKSSSGKFIWIAPVVLTILYYLPSDYLIDDLADYSYDAYTIVITSGITNMLGCYYGLVLYRMFVVMISNRETVERSDRDLQIAHDVQMASVPASFPESRSLEIYAKMESATEVGGDFYDSFLISRNLTAFIIADVSDKGLPASMLMMRMMGSFKATAMLSNDPGSILTTVNKDLCRNNPAEQFVTAWIGIYDSDTGILQYANAGHTPPFIRHKGGSFTELEVKKGPILGFSEAIRYKTSQMVMQDGDSIFTYTDGVNEAFNTEGEEYGKERLSAALNTVSDTAPKEFVDNVFSSVKRFTADCPASDDITMLSFSTLRPDYGMMTFPGKVENLDAVNGFLEDYLSDAGCPIKYVLKMQIVAEEIFVNICDHAYSEMSGDVTVYCRYYDHEIKITFCDEAEYFNPISKEDISIDDDVGNWPIGGFGIHMVKNLVTYMDYKYFAGKNIFTVWKRVESDSE